MSQVSATAIRMFKELVREKVVIFWTIMFPAIWLVMYYAIFLNGVPPEVKPAYGATVAFYKKHGFVETRRYPDLWEAGALELSRVP